jgi:hypothetical protein
VTIGTWNDPAWRRDVRTWLDEHAPGDVLAVQQPHVRPWATVLRVETTDGIVWFKANGPSQAQEGPITRILAHVRPDLLPELLAVDDERSWMLTRDAGERLRELVQRERTLDRWLEALPRYAELQLAAAPHADELVAAGAPDRRLAVLPDQFAALMRELGRPGGAALAARVRELADELAALDVAETVQHDDLHDAQIFVRDGRSLFSDWGDAVVSHPFFSMSITLEGQIAWGLDDVEDSEEVAPFASAYLGPFGPGHERALELALRLGWACRSVGVWEQAALLAPEHRDGHLAGLDIRLELLERGL